jgi:hypothetical protein
MYARLAVEQRDGRTQPITWDLSEYSDYRKERQQVASQVATAVDELMAATGSAPLLIGKSLGSLAAPVAADRGLPAVWFTPLLSDELTVAALRRAEAPYLLVGGTADKFWDGWTARSLSPHVMEVAGADHGMFVPGRLAASAAALGEVITAVEYFLDRVVWP